MKGEDVLSTEVYKATDDIQSVERIYFIPQKMVNGQYVNVSHYKTVKIYCTEEANLVKAYAGALRLVWENASFTADSVLAFTAKAEPLFRYYFASDLSVTNGSFTLELPSPLIYVPVNKIQEIEL